MVAADADDRASLERAFAGQRFDIAGEVLSGPEYAAAFSRHLGVPVSFYDMPFDEYRALGFPGADDMGNMYEHHAILGEEFRRYRSPEVARALNPALQSFACGSARMRHGSRWVESCRPELPMCSRAGS